MELFGVGPLELFVVVLLAVLIFGPKDMANGARSLGRTLNKLYRSDNFRLIQQASRELTNLPARLAREANLEELRATQQAAEQALRDPAAAAPPAPTTPPAAAANPYQAWIAPAAPAAQPPAEPPAAPSEPPA